MEKTYRGSRLFGRIGWLGSNYAHALLIYSRYQSVCCNLILGMTVGKLKNSLKNLAEPKRAEVLLRFFQTQKGEYGEGAAQIIKASKKRGLYSQYIIQHIIRSPEWATLYCHVHT